MKFAPLLAGSLLLLMGCHRRSAGPVGPPDAPPSMIEPGIEFRQITLSKFRELPPLRLWVYVPKDGKRTHPCVFIAPAGTPLTTGMAMAEEDKREQIPYARAGFVVVAYDISGAGGGPPATEAFTKRHLGIDNAKAAIDEAVAKLPIDPLRLYTVGHSSAATLALQVAAADSRIRGWVAYAPVTDEVKRIGQVGMTVGGTNFASLVSTLSPLQNVDALKCPVMLFSAEDDDNVPSESVVAFAEALKERKRDVTLVTVPSGGHYNSMIREGIPAGIKWLTRDR